MPCSPIRTMKNVRQARRSARSTAGVALKYWRPFARNGHFVGGGAKAPSTSGEQKRAHQQNHELGHDPVGAVMNLAPSFGVSL